MMVILKNNAKSSVIRGILSIYKYTQQTKKTTELSQSTPIQQTTSLMEDNYQKIKMKGLSEQRQITGVNEFQKDILTKNKFDMLNPKIEPKIATLNTSMGLQLKNNEYLTEISLGKIKVKKQNEVFLSEVDPYNIPQYHDIVFDYEKEMSLVGKKMQESKGISKIEQAPNAQMKISTHKSFEEKSKKQLSKQIFGFQFDTIFDTRIMFKKLVAALLLTYFFTSPIIITYFQIQMCLSSIKEIEEEKLKEVKNAKRRALIDSLLNKSDFHIK